MANSRILASIVLAGFIALSFPQPASALIEVNFGGKITSSKIRTCYVYVGVFSIPVPLQEVVIKNSSGTGTTKLAYIYYQFILQLFGVNTSLYQNFQFYRPGPSVIGKYIRAPIPWTNCYDLLPTNLILKIGTSLF